MSHMHGVHQGKPCFSDILRVIRYSDSTMTLIVKTDREGRNQGMFGKIAMVVD